ncbi:hypothetical protein [uncultured Oscillibacter sp.]|uniref:hypothetical protein n=1 Tax=uncultured Oscillibacter sp. TaxID=876091 RepID=UPI0025F714D7|nr:hypothetical protein [uncultured Oscillibacter sp.]
MCNQKIPMPTEAEKQRAIARILDVSLSPRPSLGRELLETLRAVGVPVLFFGTWDCLALSLLIWALCLLPALVLAGSTGSLAPALFLFSPLLYAALSLLTAWKDLQAGLWEWTWTFRVSARMVAALRMLCFGGVSVLLCVPANVLLWVLSGRERTLGWMLALSLASLFLYGALSLLCQRLRGPARWLAAPVGWVLLGLVPLIWPRAAEWLTAIPAAVFCLLAAAGIAMYLLELRRFCRRPMEGGVSYAFR